MIQNSFKELLKIQEIADLPEIKAVGNVYRIYDKNIGIVYEG